MRSIKNSFDKIQNKQKCLGAVIALSEAVKDKRYNQDTITRAFTKLVPKDEYDKSERRGLIKHLTNLSNPLEDNKIMAKNEQESLLNDRVDEVIV